MTKRKKRLAVLPLVGIWFTKPKTKGGPWGLMVLAGGTGIVVGEGTKKELYRLRANLFLRFAGSHPTKRSDILVAIRDAINSVPA